MGKKVADKDRPLRIKMKDERVRDTIMSRLTYLKDAEEKCCKISVTYDYTVEERQLIKTWVEKAKEKSEKETEHFIWKVRGDPRNGLKVDEGHNSFTTVNTIRQKTAANKIDNDENPVKDKMNSGSKQKEHGFVHIWYTPMLTL